ncbi:MAG: 4'-phosphopantetheinyl transferase superfamily protein [Chlamydiae bacterium]|nr:4'-phosphopantetheinyl transferase superfamily protein [Chlamydiota bacterium]MBI3276766.1 4'-phosphopantetheinyl transferase superfamily protein [Chlamydiota bacterium]
MNKILQLGIDLIEVSRAQSIYRNYRDKLGRYLSREERSYIKAHRNKGIAFAEMMAIKEAVFKALELPWLGLEGWRKISLSMKFSRPFSVKLLGSLKTKNIWGGKFWIDVASNKVWVLARVLYEKDLL